MNQKNDSSQHRFSNVLDNPRMRMVVAFVLAVIGWVVVTVGIQPGTDSTITNVPVDFSYDSSKYTAMGLSIVNDPAKTVSLKVYGNGSDIGGLRKEDFVVYPKYTSVKGPGVSELPLEVRCVSPNVDTSNIKVNVHPADTTVEVIFDTVEEKTVPVRVETKGVAVEDGYTLYRYASSPTEVVLTGPSGELQHVEEAIAAISSSEKLSRTTTLSAPLTFVDSAGEEVVLNYVKANVMSADVTLTVYEQAELPLVVSLINAPPGFDSSILSYQLSQQTLHVAGPSSVIKNLKELSIGVIDLSTFTTDKVYELPIEMPNGLVNLENVKTVTVSFDTRNLTTKKFNLDASAVQVINMPAGFKLDVLTNRIRNVVLCGPKKVLDGLTADSIVAQIDMDDFGIVTGQQTIAVNIYVPASNQVFALGNYSISCQIVSQ